MLPFTSWRSEKVILKPEATLYLLLFTNMYCCAFDASNGIHLCIKSFVRIALTINVTYTDTYAPIIMYFPGLVVVVYFITICCFVF